MYCPLPILAFMIADATGSIDVAQVCELDDTQFHPPGAEGPSRANSAPSERSSVSPAGTVISERPVPLSSFTPRWYAAKKNSLSSLHGATDANARVPAAKPGVHQRLREHSESLLGQLIGLVEEKRRGVDQIVGIGAEIWPCQSLVPVLVFTSICAPLVAPCCASYIEAFTRNSCVNSGGGEGRLLPFEP